MVSGGGVGGGDWRTMELYIVRHGHAERAASSDERRPLSSEGHAQAAHLAGMFAEFVPPLMARPTVVLSSGADRARLTAEIIAGAVGVEPKIEEALGLSGSVRAVAELLSALADEHESVMIVGHNPTLSDLVEHLTGRESPCLRTGELALLSNIRAGIHGEATLMDLVRLEGSVGE